MQNPVWDVWSLLTSQTQRYNTVHYKNYYLRWEKNICMQLWAGETAPSNFQNFKKYIFSLCGNTNLPEDFRWKCNFWVCFWKKKSHSTKVGCIYIYIYKYKPWSKHTLNFFSTKKESRFTVNLLSFIACKLH